MIVVHNPYQCLQSFPAFGYSTTSNTSHNKFKEYVLGPIERHAIAELILKMFWRGMAFMWIMW